MEMNYLRAVFAALAVGSFGPPTPRADRHGKRLEVEETQYTTSKRQSSKLKKLLRK